MWLINIHESISTRLWKSTWVCTMVVWFLWVSTPVHLPCWSDFNHRCIDAPRWFDINVCVHIYITEHKLACTPLNCPCYEFEIDFEPQQFKVSQLKPRFIRSNFFMKLIFCIRIHKSCKHCQCMICLYLFGTILVRIWVQHVPSKSTKFNVFRL